MKSTLELLFAALLLLTTHAYANNSKFKVETGAVWQHRNDVKILPDTGTYFEFDEFNQGPFFHHRLEGIYNFNKKHSLRLLYAPFNISVSGTPLTNIKFNGETFLANQELNVNYMFNSYRLSYIYNVFSSSSQIFSVGFTGKIRDAEIKLSQGSLSKSYDNTGFVPLFYLFYERTLFSNWFFVSDMDFAAAPQGRAIDLALKLRTKTGKNSSAGFGYRTLEGGADNDKVFTFSWLNYFVIDFAYNF